MNMLKLPLILGQLKQLPSFHSLLFNYQKADDKIFVCKFSKKRYVQAIIILRILQRLDG